MSANSSTHCFSWALLCLSVQAAFEYGSLFFFGKERLLSYVILGGCRSPVIRRYPQDKVYLFKVGKHCFCFPLLPLPQRTFYFFSCFLYDVLRVSYTKGEVLIMWPMRDSLEIYPVIPFTRILVERRQKGGNKM